ncbi:unnamed protein product [Urochloa humidicola]
MDTLFVLGQESRLRILQRAAARLPGCAYLCAWAALPASSQPPPAASSSSAAATTSARFLCCVDAWLCDGGGPAVAGCRDDGAAAGGRHRMRALFNAYRGSLCPAVSGCVPGWAYKDGLPYMELPAHDLTDSASLQAQQQFYQEAGIEMAAFMGCESGEIEVGMSTAGKTSGGVSSMSLESSLHQVFSEDFFQQSLLEELLQLPPTRPSSPSSSLPSVSVDSPAAEVVSTPLLLRAAPVATTPSSSGPDRHAPPPALRPRPPLIASPSAPFSRRRHGHFPSPEADDAAMAEAMLAVISAPSSSSSAALPTTTSSTSAAAQTGGSNNNNHRGGERRWWPHQRGTAFRAYNAALAPRAAAPWRPAGAPGQRMIKMGISILRRMHMLRFSRERTGGGAATMAQRVQEEEEEDAPPAPTSSQLNHMISERRRRERLNESFEALRGLLPPGSKKDKATVLAKTLDYMNILVAQIADLEARNRSLESRAHYHHSNGGGSRKASRPYYYSSEQQDVVVLQGQTGTSEKVQVHVTAAAGGVSSSTSSPSSSWRRPGRDVVTVRVEALAARGDVGELVARALAAIKEMGCFTVVAVDAGRPGDDGGIAQATFTLRATAGEFDEASLREAVTKAAEDSATPPSDDS